MSTRFGVLRLILYSSFALSGFAGLIYESIWSHYLKLFLGHAAYAQTIVIALFMGGLSLGSWLASRYSHRWRQLLRRYAVAEAIIGILGFLFQPLFEATTGLAYSRLMPALGSPVAVTALKLSLSALMILPPAVVLGMTFPLMSAGVVRLFPRAAGSSISMLYFTNSIGAAVGVLLSGFVLVGRLGLPGTMALAATTNLAVAAIVYVATLVFPRSTQGECGDADEGRPPQPEARRHHHYGLLLWVAALTGLASFIYEIGWIRMLSLVLGSSTHAFELMLSAFITGLALGGLWIRSRIDHIAQPTRYLALVQLAMGLLALGTILVYANSFELMREIMKGLNRTDQGYILFNVASHGLALFVMLPATFCAGMTLPLITFALLDGGCGERSIGAVYAANTVGAIAGVVVATHIGMPLLGLKGLVLLGAAVDLGLGVLLLWKAVPGGAAGRLAPAIAGIIGVVAVTATLAGARLDPLAMASGVYRYGDMISRDVARNVFHRDGKTTSVDLVRYHSGRLVLFTNGKAEASINLVGAAPATDEITMVLSAVLPLAANSDARDVAVIGMGSGQTSHVMLGASSVERVDTIEIEAAVIEAARQFGPHVERVFSDARSRIFVDDARSFLSTHGSRYDIIVAEPSNPWVSGVSSLFTRQFYELAARHLKSGGILAQWLQVYEIEPRLVASIVKALSGTFPDYAIYATDNANIVILARKGAGVGPLGPAVFRHPGIATELRRHSIHTAGDLEARRIGDAAVLQALFDSYEVPANDDYHPFLDLHAVRSRFLDHSADGLLALRTAPIPIVDLIAGSDTPSGRLSLQGAVPTRDGFGLLHLTHSARAVHEYATGAGDQALDRLPPDLRRDVHWLWSRREACTGPGATQQWLQSLFTVAVLVNPGLSARESREIWGAIAASRCHQMLPPMGRTWVSLFAAAGARDADGMADLALKILPRSGPLPFAWRGYALGAAMAGDLARGNRERACASWVRYGAGLATQAGSIGREELVFRLLRAHCGAEI